MSETKGLMCVHFFPDINNNIILVKSLSLENSSHMQLPLPSDCDLILCVNIAVRVVIYTLRW